MVEECEEFAGLSAVAHCGPVLSYAIMPCLFRRNIRFSSKTPGIIERGFNTSAADASAGSLGLDGSKLSHLFVHIYGNFLFSLYIPNTYRPTMPDWLPAVSLLPVLTGNSNHLFKE